MRIVVTAHALDRARSRFGWGRVSRDGIVDSICTDVAAAVTAGRRAKRLPRWASDRARRQKAGARGETSWYVWDANETRCYCVRPGRSRDRNGPDYVVVTALGRVVPREAA